MTNQPRSDQANEQQDEAQVSRRGFLTTGAAAALTMAMASPETVAQTTTPSQTGTARSTYKRFSEPKEWRATRGGVIDQELRVTLSEVTVLDTDPPRTVKVRNYNGQVPGPTIRMLPGDQLNIHLINDMPPNEETPEQCTQLMNANQPHCFNTTNLHTHGLHVSPKTGADNVSSDDIYVKVEPGEDRQYCIKLPDFHAPGTHWYHAHVHGSTALQVINGLAGALIIDEPVGQQIPVDSESVWVIQEVLADAADIYPPGQPGSNFMVNTLGAPTLELDPNEITRFRMINATASPRGFMHVKLVQSDGSALPSGAEFSLIAVDGITFYGHNPVPVSSDGHFMGPGNRADFLVKLPAGTYHVLKGGATDMARAADDQSEPLAIINVSGSSRPDRPLPPLPGVDKRPCYLEPIPADQTPNETRSYLFSASAGDFKINGLKYGGNPGGPPNTDVPLGNMEEWVLTNDSGAGHPFHIHVNPFQTQIKIDPSKGDDVENMRWQDTLSIPPNTTGANGLKIRQRFLTYDGKFVLHCHILVHEDLGMMQDITVNGSGIGPCVGVKTCNNTTNPTG